MKPPVLPQSRRATYHKMRRENRRKPGTENAEASASSRRIRQAKSLRPDQQRRSRDEVEQRRMFSVEAASSLRNGSLKRMPLGSREKGRSHPLSVPLLPALADADGFRTSGIRWPCGSSACTSHKACAKKEKQQQSREKLWTAEAFAREIWTHKVEPSVLPCRRLFAGKDLPVGQLRVKDDSYQGIASAMPSNGVRSNGFSRCALCSDGRSGYSQFCPMCPCGTPEGVP